MSYVFPFVFTHISGKTYVVYNVRSIKEFFEKEDLFRYDASIVISYCKLFRYYVTDEAEIHPYIRRSVYISSEVVKWIVRDDKGRVIDSDYLSDMLKVASDNYMVERDYEYRSGPVRGTGYKRRCGWHFSGGQRGYRKVFNEVSEQDDDIEIPGIRPKWFQAIKDKSFNHEFVKNGWRDRSWKRYRKTQWKEV